MKHLIKEFFFSWNCSFCFQFINVDFLVTFPHYDFVMKKQIEDMLEKLATYGHNRQLYAHLIFQPFKSSSRPFNLAWMLSKITHETNAAENEVKHMRNVTANLWSPEKKLDKQTKTCSISSSGRRSCWNSTLWIPRSFNGYFGRMRIN